jgi:hypothetical protein
MAIPYNSLNRHNQSLCNAGERQQKKAGRKALTTVEDDRVFSVENIFLQVLTTPPCKFSVAVTFTITSTHKQNNVKLKTKKQ